jgi:hypothetical protein
MNRALATLSVATSLLFILLAGGAEAAQTQVQVRIEGKSETLFEGPVSTEPHGVRAASDKISKLRRCDGINVNDPWNTVPGVTPTAVSADAMSLIGQSFDGQWYKQYEDYFVTRFGPDLQEPAAPNGGAYWGILVNNTFTNVGGCQYQLDNGDEVLWVFDAFRGNRTWLALFPEAAGYTAGTRPLTVTGVAPNQAVPLEVVSYADNVENNPPPIPTRTGSSPYEGAKVSPVLTAANGFGRIETATGSTTDAQGKTVVSFSEPGWHRVKATVGTPGAETVIRSNRLDICVSGGGGAPLEGAVDCNELPAADKVRSAIPTSGEIEGEAGPPAPAPAPSPPAAGSPPPGPLKVSTPKVDRGKLAQGRLTISWTVTDTGPGVKKWTISSQTIGQKKARWVTRASGAKKTKATIKLPKGDAYRLRFAIVDVAGKTTTKSLGKVQVPEAGGRRPR